MKQRLIISSLVLFVLALGFNALLNFTSLNKLVEESIVSQYQVIGKDLQRNLEKYLSFAKDISKFTAISQILEETKRSLTTNMIDKELTDRALRSSISEPNISLSLALPDGSILYSTDEDFANTKMPEEAWVDYEKLEDEKDSFIESYQAKSKNMNFLTLPVRDAKNKWIATIIMGTSENQIKVYQNPPLKNNLTSVLIILTSGILILLVSLNHIIGDKPDRQTFPKIKISITIFLVIGAAQIALSGLTTNTFEDHYMHINKEKTRIVANLLKDDIESLLERGFRIDGLSKMEVLMGEIVASFPELNDITLYNRKWEPMFIATKKDAIDSQKAKYTQLEHVMESMPRWNPKYNVRLNVMRNDKTEGYISMNIARNILYDKLFEIAMDCLTVLVISLLFFVEMLILIFKFIERQAANDSHRMEVHYSFIRPVFFLLLFGIDFSISFVPLHMERLYEPMFGLSKDMVLSLPVSLSVFFAGVGFFIAGAWNDRRGWYEPFLSGVFLAGTGNIYSWLAPNSLQFVIAQVITGLGYGLAFMASQGFVILYTDKKTKAQGFATLFAALYAGGFCGSSTGAMLAERIGYRPVFLLGAVIIFSTIGYTLVFMQHAIKKKTDSSVGQRSRNFRIKEILRFLSKRNVLTLILFSSIPANMAMIGFLNYFNPVYLSRIGISQSNIGRTFMIYCALSIYVGPWISKYIDASGNKKGYLVAGGILGSMAFMVYYYFHGLAASIIAILLLGFSQSFVFVSQAAYLLKLKASHDLGEGKAIASFRLMNYFAQVIGPITFSWLIVTTDINNGLTYLGLSYMVLTFFFLISAQSDTKIAETESKESLTRVRDLAISPQSEPETA